MQNSDGKTGDAIAPQIRVHVGSAIFPSTRQTKHFPEGTTVREIVDGLGLPERPGAYAFAIINGEEIPPERWADTHPNTNATINVAFIPAGDSPTWRQIARESITLAAVALPQMFVPAPAGWALSAGGTSASIVRGILPIPPMPPTGSTASRLSSSINGQRQG